MYNYFHIFRENDNLNMQRYFIFLDTETKRIATEEKFKLGWAIFYDREQNTKEYFFFVDKNDFWDWFYNRVQDKDVIVYAHNMDFDIKVLGGFDYICNKGYELTNFYVEGIRYIVKLINVKSNLYFWDTLNYIPMSLKKIGDSIGLKKMDIDFNTCSDNELKIYCKNDVEILYLFITKLIKFLTDNNLSKLKPTVSSLSFNIFRHHFYDKQNNPIYIHNWYRSVKLEKESYKGGITDCFKIGEFKNKMFKLDINSMYPYIMKKEKLPVKLIYHSNINENKNLLTMLDKELKDNNYHIIANVKIKLPSKYAYILVKSKVNKQNKSLFLCGKFNTVLTTPELQFVKKYGEILEVNDISIYKKSIIFDKFVEFFYNKRNEFKQDNNDAYSLFCKYILNSLYGKFGQMSFNYVFLEYNDKQEFSSEIHLDGITNTQQYIMKFGNKIFEVENKGDKSFDTFIAIPSFITAYARMYLVRLILLSERSNVYYVDTDCLFVNIDGYKLLKDYIDKAKLGKLKVEGTSLNTKIIKPKFYEFDDNKKCKGVKKNAKILVDNDNNLIIEQEQFMRTKTSLRKDFLNKQLVNIVKKHISKQYDKGIVKDGIVYPYEVII